MRRLKKTFSEYSQRASRSFRSKNKMLSSKNSVRKTPQTSFHRRLSIRSFSRFVYGFQPNSLPKHLNAHNILQMLLNLQSRHSLDLDNSIWMAHSISPNWRSDCGWWPPRRLCIDNMYHWWYHWWHQQMSRKLCITLDTSNGSSLEHLVDASHLPIWAKKRSR